MKKKNNKSVKAKPTPTKPLTEKQLKNIDYYIAKVVAEINHLPAEDPLVICNVLAQLAIKMLSQVYFFTEEPKCMDLIMNEALTSARQRLKELKKGNASPVSTSLQ